MKQTTFTGEYIYQNIIDKIKIIDEYADALGSVKHNKLAEEVLKKELIKIENELQILNDKEYILTNSQINFR